MCTWRGDPNNLKNQANKRCLCSNHNQLPSAARAQRSFHTLLCVCVCVDSVSSHGASCCEGRSLLHPSATSVPPSTLTVSSLNHLLLLLLLLSSFFFFTLHDARVAWLLAQRERLLCSSPWQPALRTVRRRSLRSPCVARAVGRVANVLLGASMLANDLPH